MKRIRKQGLLLIITSYVLAYLTVTVFNIADPVQSWPPGADLMMAAAYIASFSGSYMYVKSKGRHARWTLLAILGLVGHIVIFFFLKDYTKKNA